MEVWSGWDPLLSIARYALIRDVILDCAHRVALLHPSQILFVIYHSSETDPGDRDNEVHLEAGSCWSHGPRPYSLRWSCP